MPYASDGSFTRTTGTYTGTTAWAQEAAVGNTIQASKFDTHDADIVSAIGTGIGQWTTWTPTITAAAPMTISATSIKFAKYLRTGKRVELILRVAVTTATGASNEIFYTLPVSCNTVNSVFIGVGGGTVLDNSATLTASIGVSSATLGNVLRYDGAVFTVGAGEEIRVHLVYEAA